MADLELYVSARRRVIRSVTSAGRVSQRADRRGDCPNLGRRLIGKPTTRKMIKTLMVAAVAPPVATPRNRREKARPFVHDGPGKPSLASKFL
jgi:hypothetical protein